MTRVENGAPRRRLRPTRAQALAQHLETEILDESLAAGARIGTKGELRARFGVAAATVNEAIRMMEMRGLISARPGPGGGVFVADASSRSRLTQMALGIADSTTTLGDCVDIRNALEPLICRRAAWHCRPQDIDALRKIVGAMGEVTHEPRTYLRLNWTLHRMIGDLCQNPPLQSFYRMLIDVLDDGLDQFEFGGPQADGATVHRMLVEAIAAGDEQTIEEAVERHAQQSPLIVQDDRRRSQRELRSTGGAGLW